MIVIVFYGAFPAISPATGRLGSFSRFMSIFIYRFISPHYTIFINETGQYRCQHALNAHADTKAVRQSPMMSADIVTNTDSNMLVTAGGVISQERAGKSVDMGDSGKLNERVSFSVINTFARTIADRRSLRKRPALTTSFQKLMAVLMTIPILSRCAGNATEQRHQENVFDDNFHCCNA
ncbi:hypothetical protein SK34_03329 [Citrobacter sp. MGH104]|nr:hypothetical protein SK34_03329 [Citrobacter sp. MGH104]